MVDRNMTTARTVTQKWQEPILRGATDKKQLQQIGASDAQIVCEWLNATHRTRYTKLRDLYAQLDELQKGTEILKEQHRELRRKVMTRDTSGLSDLETQHRRKFRQLELHQAANRALSPYVFRPVVGYTSITETRNAGLAPDTNKRWFQLQYGQWILSEADAAIALVRLYLSGEWRRLRLCERCKQRWLVAAKSHYRFCGDECRENFYAESQGFKERRKQIQKEYRKRLKKREQARAYD
jgi:hypothetical protein